MESNLPKEDLNLIAQIDARLKHYNLIAPIEQVEQPKKQEDIEQAGNKCQIVNDFDFDGNIDFMYKTIKEYFNQIYKDNGK
jgi:hypothetical protein